MGILQPPQASYSSVCTLKPAYVKIPTETDYTTISKAKWSKTETENEGNIATSNFWWYFWCNWYFGNVTDSRNSWHIFHNPCFTKSRIPHKGII